MKNRTRWISLFVCAIFSALVFVPEVLAAETSAVDNPQLSQENVATVHLNSADAATLQKELVGVGEVKAAAIVAYRKEHGNFKSVDELLEVKGIGKTILDKNRNKLTVD